MWKSRILDTTMFIFDVIVIIILNLCLYSIYNFVYKCYCRQIIDILFFVFSFIKH